MSLTDKIKVTIFLTKDEEKKENIINCFKNLKNIKIDTLDYLLNPVELYKQSFFLFTKKSFLELENKLLKY